MHKEDTAMVRGLQYALKSRLFEELKSKITQMHAFSLSSITIMQKHTKVVRKLALSNGVVTCDTFLLPYNVRNI